MDAPPAKWCANSRRPTEATHDGTIDDSTNDLRQSIAHALSTKLYELMGNGKRAFDACDAYSIDLILDEIMPLIRPEVR